MAVAKARFGLVLTVFLCTAVPSVASAQPGSAATPRSGQVGTTAIAVSAARAPQHFLGTDGRQHIVYDLVITNVFTADVTLTSLEVRDGHGKVLLRLEGDALSAVTFEMLGETPTATVRASSTVSTDVEVPVTAKALPTHVTNRLTYSVPPDAPFSELIESSQVRGPKLPVSGLDPIVISPPVNGAGWLAFNACCQPSSHFEALYAANGSFVSSEQFAIDWLRLEDGRLFEGDGSTNSQWYGEGAGLRAVADGKVVAAVDGKLEIAPAPFGLREFTSLDEHGGNYVVLRIAPDAYAFYAHMQPGTLRVDVGQRVRAGERLGSLGSSGNSNAPHVHFSVNDGPDPKISNSVPYVFDHFRSIGTGTVTPVGTEGALDPTVPVTGTPRKQHGTYPVTDTVVNF